MGKYICTVQGEGRGHLTQAISLSQIAQEAGHEIIAYAVGSTNNRKIPSFFTDFIGDKPLLQYESPSLCYGNGKAVQVGKTAFQAFSKFKTYWKSASELAEFIEAHQPDGIINFYESITGLHQWRTGSKTPCLSIGHQYLLLNRHFESIPEKKIDQFFLNLNTKITGIGSKKKLGLSFLPLENDLQRNIEVIPPLLRKEVKALQAEQGKNWLAYLTHYRLAEDIMAWSKQNPDVQLDCFWDHPTHHEIFHFSENLTFHPINAEKYLEKMSQCAGLISTAGFESIAEAMYLSKPTMMVPVPNHIEQMINAFDASHAGAGLAAKTFDLSLFKDYQHVHRTDYSKYQEWIQESSRLMDFHLRELIQPKQEKKRIWKSILTKRINWTLPKNNGGLSFPKA
ncbi:glycosyltransferase family protein [Aquirufa nivalisilvae]|uniref:glycosyltransferase family protein n=1 Tax=Aquirufa nivalisilvae TaxID=2516557 RepID=UPI0022A96DDB|nr:glycosyltransferase family protein [Aquirufa nivalisilvae]MCZ2479348.1 glycosyl transferase [Aquirufa nivalisilvae]